jgi:ribosomal protein S18 acetylase RimI-like enzyme
VLGPIRPATPDDFDEVWQLYLDVCEHQARDQYGPRWTPGIYPAEGDIRSHMAEGELYVQRLGDQIVAAMALVMREDPEYVGVPWPTKAAPEDVAVIHLLAVHPSARGLHVGVGLAREAVRLARAAGKRAVHLDVVPGNLAASRVYLEAGFSLVGTYEIFYEDTGVMGFEMYECAL